MIEKICATRLRYNKQTNILQYLLLLRFHKINNIINEQNQYITKEQRCRGKFTDSIPPPWLSKEKFVKNSSLNGYFNTLTYLDGTARLVGVKKINRSVRVTKIVYKKYSQVYVRLNQTLLSMVERKRVRTN